MTFLKELICVSLHKQNILSKLVFFSVKLPLTIFCQMSAGIQLPILEKKIIFFQEKIRKNFMLFILCLEQLKDDKECLECLCHPSNHCE